MLLGGRRIVLLVLLCNVPDGAIIRRCRCGTVLSCTSQRLISDSSEMLICRYGDQKSLFHRNFIHTHHNKTFEPLSMSSKNSRRDGSHNFERMGDLFFGDTGERIFAFVLVPHIPGTVATSKMMRELARKRIREVLAVARTLNVYSPITMKDVELLTLRSLRLCGRTHTKLGHKGMTAFSEAIRAIGVTGALANLEDLLLGFNQIGDEGMKSFSIAVASGALANCKWLNLSANGIGDEGMNAFFSAISKGALDEMVQLNLWLNEIGDIGLISFLEAIRRGALKNLRHHSFPENKIGDAGMKAISVAITNGSLGPLKSLDLDCNKISNDGMIAFANAIKPILRNPMLAMLVPQNLYIRYNPGSRVYVEDVLADLEDVLPDHINVSVVESSDEDSGNSSDDD